MAEWASYAALTRAKVDKQLSSDRSGLNATAPCDGQYDSCAPRHARTEPRFLASSVIEELRDDVILPCPAFANEGDRSARLEATPRTAAPH